MRKPINTLIFLGVLALAAGPLLAADIGDQQEELQNAQETVKDAAQVVEQLRQDADTRGVINKAKAVLIVPDYGRASLGIGGAGGQGVLMVNNNGTWSGPAFYNIGSINLGLEAGVEAGSIAFMIMTDDAMQAFSNENNFSLNADAGLTIVNWSKRGQVSAGKGADVIAWADTEGLYGNLSVSATNIFWDGEANRAYYNKDIAARDAVQGKLHNPHGNSPLEAEFSALESGSKQPMNQQPSSSQTPMDREPANKPQSSNY